MWRIVCPRLFVLFFRHNTAQTNKTAATATVYVLCTFYASKHAAKQAIEARRRVVATRRSQVHRLERQKRHDVEGRARVRDTQRHTRREQRQKLPERPLFR